jgi:AAA domain
MGLRLPYRLPELLAAPATEPVFICEGEKDSNSVAALGLVATTNPGGAGKWSDVLSKWFAGKHTVYVLEDNDAAGHVHAAKVAASLQGIVPEVRIVSFSELPEHGDISDWLEHGGTKEQLLGRARNAKAPLLRFRMQAFDDVIVGQEPAYLVRGIIPRVGLVTVWGPAKCGKSFWMFDTAMHVALGWEYRGLRVQQGPVVYLALEGGKGFLARIEAFRKRFLTGGAPRCRFIWSRRRWIWSRIMRSLLTASGFNPVTTRRSWL